VPILSGNFPAKRGNIRRVVFTAWRGKDASRMAIVYARGASNSGRGNLGATGVTGTAKEDSQHPWNRRLVLWMKRGMQFAYQHDGCASPHGWKPTSGSFSAIFASFWGVRDTSPSGRHGYVTVAP